MLSASYPKCRHASRLRMNVAHQYDTLEGEVIDSGYNQHCHSNHEFNHIAIRANNSALEGHSKLFCTPTYSYIEEIIDCNT